MQRDLYTVIAEAGGRLHPHATLAVLEPLAAALMNAYSAGLSAATPGTANIVVSGAVEAGNVWVAAPPEGGARDPRNDVYALAAVAYECLTGQAPTAAPIAGAPPGVEQVLARAMAADPGARYQSPGEFAAAYRSALTGGYPAAPGVPVPEAGALPYPEFPVYWSPVPRRSGWDRALPALLVVVMVVAVGGYALLGWLTKSAWLGGDPREGVRVTLSANGSDGSSPSAAALSQTRDIVAERLGALGINGADVAIDGSGLVVTAPGDGTEVGIATRPTRLNLRPVLNMIPREQLPSTGSPPPAAPAAPAIPGEVDAKRIIFEKNLRQSPNQNVLTMLALPYVGERCGQPDPLAGRDDPDLPLVTCSKNGDMVYLLDKSIITADQITSATSAFSKDSSQHVVELQFNADAAARWSNFTAANIGQQVGFTLDTQVISAPQINETIPNGKTVITGNFSSAEARELATALQSRPLPLILSATSSTPETVAGEPPSDRMRVLMIGLGAIVAVLVIGCTTYLAMRRYRTTDFGGQAAEVR